MAVYIPIISEFKDRGIKDAEREMKGFSSKISKSLGGVMDVAKKTALTIGAIGTGAAFALAPAIDAAADLEEEISKTRQIFGDASSEIEKFADTAAKRLGQSKKDALSASSTFAIFGKSAGLTGSDLVDFSSDFNVLASDLASFFNTSPEDAITAIGAALRGESEPIRRFGVLLNEATLREKALQLGLIKNTKQALTPQQKVLAAQAAIYEQTIDAQGDFERTSGGLANQQRILKAQFANVVAELGAKLLPIVTKIVSFINDRFIPAIEAVVGWFGKKGFGGVVDFITQEALPKLRDKLGEFAKAFAEWIPDATRRLLENLPSILSTILQWVLKEGIPKLIEYGTKMAIALAGFTVILGVEVIKGLGSFIKNTVKELPTLFAAMFEGMTDTGKMMGGYLVRGIGAGLRAGLDIVTGAIKSILNGVLSLIEKGVNIIFEGINSIIRSAEWTNGPANYPRLKPVDIPQLANGGIVKARNGGTLALIGEGGRDEAVVPLGRGGSAFPTGMNITVNAGIGTDGRAVGAQIVDAIRAYERTNGVNWRS